jgi:uncharacterized protein YjbI with pentapeptide repeats
VLDLQNKIRQTVIQVAAGFGFLFSALWLSKVRIWLSKLRKAQTQDLQAKYDRETAELFIKATEANSAEALYALSYIARRDKENYHETVYRMISSLVRNAAPIACGEAATGRNAAIAKVQVAMRLLQERDTKADLDQGKYNIEYSCLSGVDLLVERPLWGRYRGLANIRASGSKLVRADLTRAELQETEFMGIDAGDWRNPGWEAESHRYDLHHLDSTGQPEWKALRRKYTTLFVEANLTHAKFHGAGLEGADFSGAVLTGAEFDGANISRTNFRGVTGLLPGQLKNACVEKPDGTAGHSNQPVFDGDKGKEIGKIGEC